MRELTEQEEEEAAAAASAVEYLEDQECRRQRHRPLVMDPRAV